MVAKVIAENGAIIAKYLFASTVLVASSAVPGINQVSVPFLGVPLTAITMAAAGSACAFAWPQGETSRAKLFGVAIASTFVGAACVSIIPQLFGREWPRELQPPLAFVFGLMAPWVVPAFKGAIPAFFKGLSAMLVRMVAGKVESDNYTPQQYKPRKPDEGED